MHRLRTILLIYIYDPRKTLFFEVSPCNGMVISGTVMAFNICHNQNNNFKWFYLIGVIKVYWHIVGFNNTFLGISTDVKWLL